MKTLSEYCEQTINDKLSVVAIKKEDIDRGDTDIKDMTSSLIKSMSNQKLYICVKITPDGIRFDYLNNRFYLYNITESKSWILSNRTMKAYLDSEAYENRWHKYDDFTGKPQTEDSDSDSDIAENDVNNDAKAVDTVEDTVDTVVQEQSIIQNIKSWLSLKCK